MPDPNIDIKIKVTSDQAARDVGKTADELKKLKTSADSAGDATDKLTGRQKKMVDGLKAIGREIPILGTLLHAVKNPFTLLGVAGVAAFAAIKKAIEESKQSQEDWKTSAANVSVSLKAYSDITKAVDSLRDAQAGLLAQTNSVNAAIQSQVDLLGESIGQQIKVLEAQKSLEDARIERDVADPVEKARKLRENELTFGARTAALRGSLPGQQAQLVEGQIAAERRLQIEAVEEVPDEAQLRAAVQGVEKDRAGLQSALVTNRQKFQRAELLRKAVRGDDVFKEFTAGQRAALESEGVIFQNRNNGEVTINTALAQKLLPGAEAESTLAKNRVGSLRSSLNAGLGSLPAGVATEADIPGFLSAAESSAAKTANASYSRQQTLEAQRARLLNQQSNEVSISRITQQTAVVRGDASVAAAVDAATKEMGRATAESLKARAEEIRALEKQLRGLSQNQR